MSYKEQLEEIDKELVRSIMVIDSLLGMIQAEPERKVTQNDVKAFIAATTSIVMSLHLQIGLVREHLGLRDIIKGQR